jgi:hypothetical protein
MNEKKEERMAVSACTRKSIRHAAGEQIPGTRAYGALCGDTRGIRRIMRGYVQTYLPIDCPSCLQIINK